MRSYDIRVLTNEAERFERRLEGIKAQNRDKVRPGWYPYPTLTGVGLLERLLKGEHRDLSRLIGEGPVLDLGTGDGDMAFFLESIGAEVHAIDHPSSNYNRMRGIHVLKSALESRIEVRSVDLDRQFTLSASYGLVVFLGVLYHLKNPFYVLETIARHAGYCILSTRIARVSPDGRVPLDSIPVAYLVGDRETNDDPTNFWIFSETGLKLLLERAGWDILEFMTTGRKSKSDPVHGERDERAFCLLRSRVRDFTGVVKLGEGWHDIEDGRWRWTKRTFEVTIERVSDSGELVLRFYVPDSVMTVLGKVGLAAEVNGVALERCVYDTPGELVYRAAIPTAERVLNVRFILDETFSAEEDGRELGILVSFQGQTPVEIMASEEHRVA